MKAIESYFWGFLSRVNVSIDIFNLLRWFLVPSNPECEDVKDIVLVFNRNNATITLSMANFSESIRKQSCIKMEDKQDDIACKPAEQNVLFENLTPSTPYNFSLFSYVKVPGQEKLISNSGCPFSKYTCKLYFFHTFKLYIIFCLFVKL